MIPLNEAIEIIDREVKRLPSKSVSILEAVGCELREDIISPLNIPPFANSAMDGYAIRIDDLEGKGPWRLPIQQVIAAGDAPDNVLQGGYAAKIMTGAPLPSRANAVIKVEDVSADGDHVVIKSRPPVGNHVRPVGDDIKRGKMLYRSGVVLDPVAIGVLASTGRLDVKITLRPRVAVLSTGSELANPGEEISRGQIYNSNDFVLKSLLKRDGLEIFEGPSTAMDEVEGLCAALTEGFADHDLVIASGGVSMGDFDLIPDAVKKLDGRILFHKVIIKPGKPVLLAKIMNRWLLGLPGNPVSVFVGYHLYARRIIARLSGREYSPKKGRAVLGSEISIKGNRHQYIGARIDEGDNGLIAYPSPRQQSGRLYSIAGINGFISVAGGTRVIEKGTEVDIEWLG